MSTAKSATLLGIVGLASVGCVPDLEEDLSQLREPRLLALGATPAEAREGQTTTLRALVAAPEGSIAPTPDFRLCVARKPLTELGPVNPVCLEDDDGSGSAVQALGSGLEVSAALPKDACKLFGPLRPAPVEGEPSGRPVDPDVSGGFYQPFVADLASVLSIGGIRIDCDLATASRDDSSIYRQRYRPNENPLITRVDLLDDGDTLLLDDRGSRRQVRAGATLELSAGWDDCPTESTCGDGFCTANEDRVSCAEDCTEPHGCGGSEQYFWYDAKGRAVKARREGLVVAWYASRGRFAEEQTGFDEAQAASARRTRNRWMVGDQPGLATVWLVIRDSRGGQSWRSLYFTVAP
jgi:hypothetical protein